MMTATSSSPMSILLQDAMVYAGVWSGWRRGGVQAYVFMYLKGSVYFSEPKQKNSHAPYCEDGSAVVPSKDLCGRMNNSNDFIL